MTLLVGSEQLPSYGLTKLWSYQAMVETLSVKPNATQKKYPAKSDVLPPWFSLKDSCVPAAQKYVKYWLRTSFLEPESPLSSILPGSGDDVCMHLALNGDNDPATRAARCAVLNGARGLGAWRPMRLSKGSPVNYESPFSRAL